MRGVSLLSSSNDSDVGDEKRTVKRKVFVGVGESRVCLETVKEPYPAWEYDAVAD